MASETMYGYVEEPARVCIENTRNGVLIEAYEEHRDGAPVGRATVSAREAELLAHMLEFGDEDVILTTQNVSFSTWDRKFTLTFTGGEEVCFDLYVMGRLAQALRNAVGDARGGSE